MHTKQIQNCEYNILCQLVMYFAKKKKRFYYEYRNLC